MRRADDRSPRVRPGRVHVPVGRRPDPLESHLANLAAYSGSLVLGRNATERFTAEERDILTDVFPHGTVEEHYVVSPALAVS
ncbi:hypothetical protein C5F59_037610 [Streptomyces sp. QL37]|uniref:hypothetical protein n=1 Tax=Streptomyces sp. QL37 TaxID=2093747 RepID=UPI000CF23DED|nr:hypothetical protein [Streptomyces sp. QL37]PPQ61842.1 hypothetical protein C5F59_38120 [Streptomyces sp. QL37]